ncbi:MAG: hypothetical protein WD942_00180 [Dehalococcoidia bacterium]
MTVSALTWPKGPTRLEVAEQAAANIHEACDRLERLYQGLSAPGVLDEEAKRERLLGPLPSLEAFRRAASVLERRIGVEMLMYSGLEAGDDTSRPGLLPLRYWEFIAGHAAAIASSAERAFALDLPDAAAHLFIHVMELLSRVALELDGNMPPPKPKGTAADGDIPH